MSLSQLRLITFDVTDTLLKFKTSPGQEYGEIGALYGISCDRKLLGNSFKANFRKMCKEHPIYGRYTGLGWEGWWRSIVKESFRSCNVNIEEKTLETIASHLISMYNTSSVWRLAHGASGLLSYIRSKSVPMGIVSNYDPRLSSILVNTKLKHYFEFVLTSYEAGFEKPDPKIFLEAMSESKIKELRPEECLHIGDQQSLDYDGARNCGWNAFLISDIDKETYPNVDKNHVFNNLFDLHKHFIQTSNEPLFSHTL